ncbi:MAG: ferredoxin [Candidatus Omnitrophica bacterium]|nr:ferredoxin [Candidatus Omnitrophota bacterium]
MANVRIDEALCTGCGLCTANCPDAFEMNSNNKAVVKNAESGSCDMNQAAGECPVEAIIVS